MPTRCRPRSPGRRQEGFTFLELLLVVLIISVCAAMALPRVSGAFRQHRYALQKEAVADLARHAERWAHLTGRACALHWEPRDHGFLLVALGDGGGPPGAELGFLLTRPEPLSKGSGPSVSAAEFALFAEKLRGQLEQPAQGTNQDRPNPDLTHMVTGARGRFSGGSSTENDRVLASVMIDEGLSVRSMHLPVVFDAWGPASSGTIILQRADGVAEELVVGDPAVGLAWREL